MTTLNNVTRIGQVVLAGAGIAGGFWAGSQVIKAAYRNDLVGDPSRVVEMDDKWIVDQPREPQGPGLTKAMMGAGALVAGIGAALTLGHVPVMSAVSMARSGAGALLFAGGVGLLVGSIATSMQYRGADVRPV
jgi:hypothetical protein